MFFNQSNLYRSNSSGHVLLEVIKPVVIEKYEIEYQQMSTKVKTIDFFGMSGF